MSHFIEDALRDRRIEPFTMERAQIEKHVQSAFLDLKEARVVFTVSDKAAYLFAYTAMLKIGRALLFLKGYRPRGEGQHDIVVKAAGAILGEKYEVLTQQFGRMRQKRNKLIYDIGGLISHAEVEKAFRSAEEYVEKVRRFMEQQDPQLKFQL